MQPPAAAVASTRARLSLDHGFFSPASRAESVADYSAVWAVLAAAASLVVFVLLATVAGPSPGNAMTVLFVPPIALLGLRFGRLGGTLAALAALGVVGLFEATRLLGDGGLDPVGLASRSGAFLVLGVVVGQLGSQARSSRSILERRVVRGTADLAAANSALTAERDFLAAALEALDEGIVACDATGALTFVNDVARRRSDVSGSLPLPLAQSDWDQHFDLYHADGRTAMWAEENPLQRAFAGEVFRDARIVVAGKAGKRRTLLATGRPIVGADGRRHGAVVATHDVTEELDLRRRLERSIEGAMLRLARAVEYRDAETAEHVERMGRHCGLLAERAGLPAERCAQIEIASRLHDIGKVAVPDAVLHKRGKLDPAEWQLMERHTVIGHALLAGSENPLLDLAASIALSHHEWVDGTGYPHGLEGDAIPLEGRIAAIADAYDALTSDRPYRAAFGDHEAREIMSRHRNTHYDGDLLDLFLEKQSNVAGAQPSPSVDGPDAGIRDTLSDSARDLYGYLVAAEPGADQSGAAIRDTMTAAAADLYHHLADRHDDDLAQREREHGPRGDADGGTDARQAGRDRRWAADERVRTAAERAGERPSTSSCP